MYLRPNACAAHLGSSQPERLSLFLIVSLVGLLADLPGSPVPLQLKQLERGSPTPGMRYVYLELDTANPIRRHDLTMSPDLRLRFTCKMALVVCGVFLNLVGCRAGEEAGLQDRIVEPSSFENLDPAVRRLITRLVGVAKLAPDEAINHGRLGLAYEANDLWPEARESFALAMKIDPSERLWRYHYAIATAEVGEFQAALELYQEIARQDPAFAPVQQRLGLALIETGDFGSAQTAFEQVIEAEPERPEGYLGAAEARLRQSEPQPALELIEKSLEIDPVSPRAQYLLGLVYRDLGRSQESTRALELGAGAKPSAALPDSFSGEIQSYAVSLPVQVARADALRQQGEFSESARILESCLIDHPRNTTLLNSLGSAFLSMREPDRAHQYLTKAVEVDGGNFETYVLLAFWALETEKLEEALRFAEEAVELAPGLAEPYTVRARVLVWQRRYDEAIADMEKALELEIRNPQIYLGLGVLYLAQGDADKAYKLYSEAVASWPDLPPAQVGLGSAALVLGRLEEARTALAAAQALAPENPEVVDLAQRLGAATGGR